MRHLVAVALLALVACGDPTEPPDPLVGTWSAPTFGYRLTGVTVVVTQSGHVLGGEWAGTLEACPDEAGKGKSCPFPVSGILTGTMRTADNAVSFTLDRVGGCAGVSDLAGRFAGDSIVGISTTRIACTGELIASDSVVLTRN